MKSVAITKNIYLQTPINNYNDKIFCNIPIAFWDALPQGYYMRRIEDRTFHLPNAG
jgi:hypothetical protein